MENIIEHQKAYLLRCQLPSGAFRVSPASDWINPYFANVGLVSLTVTGENEAVLRHIDWYLTHLSKRGYVNDYRLNGGVVTDEVDKGSADSEDSYNATLFTLLACAVRQTDRIKWIEERQEKLAAMLVALLKLQQRDGLTWAKESYKVKYLMDNCEVLRGLEDAWFLFDLIGDVENAALALDAASRCRTGLSSMYQSSSGCYAMYDRVFPKWRKWYPDVTSQAFPLLYRLLPADDPAALAIYSRIVESFPSFESFQTGDLYPWMVMGECALVMGDLGRAERMLWAAENLYIYGPRLRYWLIHEAGAFIRIALQLAKNA